VIDRARLLGWLLVKDLQILRRTPLLVALLVLYPVVIALLIGLALSRGPDRPKVAFVNEVPTGQRLEIGGRRLDLLSTRAELYDRIDPVAAATRDEAIEKVRGGEALGAVIVPRDAVTKLEAGFQRPAIDVFVNEEDPLKGRLVDDAITSILASANQRLSRAIIAVLLRYEGLLLRGGPVSVFGQRFNVLGLEKVERIARRTRTELPPDSTRYRQLTEVARFARLARANLDVTDDVLKAVSQPIGAHKQVVSGSKVPFTTFAAAIAVAISLMFVTVMLAAASLALERSENGLVRLVRGPVTRIALLGEKLVLATACSVALTLLMLLGLGIFVPLEWDRFALWLVALVFGAAAFAALGVAIGGLVRDVAATSLLAFALLLPVAFLALVPSGVVSEGVYDVSRVVSALFPFRPALDAISSALYGNGGIVGPLLHLTALAAAFTLAGRVALRRFA
jgi:ABC-type multidrug transport system permease subunit